MGVSWRLGYPTHFFRKWRVKSPLLSPTAFAIYIIFFGIGVIGALVIPSFSLFLASELNVRPLLVGIPFAGIAIASIGYNFLLGGWSDRLDDRRPLIATLCLLSCVACSVFALVRDYWIIAVTATLVFSLSMVSFSQVMAYSLDYADKQISKERAPLFNSIVRAQIALAWVIGPPLGFILVDLFGFAASYSSAAILSLLLCASVLIFLPPLKAKASENQTKGRVSLGNIDHHANGRLSPQTKMNSSLVLCVIGFSLFWGVNNAYLIGLPIHLTENLEFSASWMGWVMGATAAFEVPFMIVAGLYAARIPLIRLIYVAGASALILYAGIFFATELWQLFALQIFNAAFIGILAGLGVSVVQLLMPGESGRASALYTNTTHVGNLLSSLMVSVIADIAGYREIFLANLIIVGFAIVCFMRIRFPSVR